MAKAGQPSLMSIDGLAVLGFVEGLKAYPLVLRKVREAVNVILEANPRSVVLIDSWGFMVRIAKQLKARGYSGRIIKYVAPQVWATRPKRAKILSRHVDHLLSTQPMDAPYFKAAGLAQTFVGNPVLDKDYRSGSRTDFVERHKLDPERPIIGLLFGSRPAEINRVGPAILSALDAVQSVHPEVQSVCVVADPVRSQVMAFLKGRATTAVDQIEFMDAVASFDMALACSGTVTTQLAAAGVPSVVLYELSPLTYFVASRLFQQRYVSLVNMSADSGEGGLLTPLMPEFLQDEIHGSGPGDAVIDFLNDPKLTASTRSKLIQETQRMGAGFDKASDRAAQAILDLMN